MKKWLFLIVFFLLIVPVNASTNTKMNVKETDVELTNLLKEANIQFNADDIYFYAGNKSVPLMIRYGGFDVKEMKIKGYGIQEQKMKIKDITDNVKKITGLYTGQIKQTFEYLPFIAVEVPREKLFEFADEIRKNIAGSVVSIPSIFHISLDKSVPYTGANNIWNLRDQLGRNVYGTGVNIAIIDTGIDYTHPDFSGRIINGYDFINNDNDPTDDNGHGTHVASIAAGSGAASSGKYKGVAPGANLLVAKACYYDGSCYPYSLIRAIEWAVTNNANIISMSLGGSNSNLNDAMKWAVNNGVVVVVAAGNDGYNDFPELGKLAYGTISGSGQVEEVITVGAMSITYNNLGQTSSRGPTSDLRIKPDIVAPGGACAARASGTTGSLVCGNDKYVSKGGTSMATPHVAGAVALILQLHPTWNPERVKNALLTVDYTATPKLDDIFNVYKYGSQTLTLNTDVIKNPPIMISPPRIDKKTDFPQDVIETMTFTNLRAQQIGIRIDDGNLRHATIGDNVGTTTSNPTQICINSGSSNTADITLHTIDPFAGLIVGYFNLNIYSDCTFSQRDYVWSVPIGWVSQSEISMNIKGLDNYFGPEDIKYADVFIARNRTLDPSEIKGFWDSPELEKMKLKENLDVSSDTQFSFSTTWKKFDVFVVYKIKNDNQKKFRQTYVIKSVDMTSSPTMSVNIEENGANTVTTNAYDIVKSLSLDCNTEIYEENYVSPILYDYGDNYEGQIAVKYNTNTKYTLFAIINAKKEDPSITTLAYLLWNVSLPTTDWVRNVETKKFSVVYRDISRYVFYSKFIRYNSDFGHYLPQEYVIYENKDSLEPISNISYIFGQTEEGSGFVEIHNFAEPLPTNNKNIYMIAKDPILRVSKSNNLLGFFVVDSGTSLPIPQNHDYNHVIRDCMNIVCNNQLTIYDPSGSVAMSENNQMRIVNYINPDDAEILQHSYFDGAGKPTGDYRIVWESDLLKDKILRIDGTIHWDGSKWDYLCNVRRFNKADGVCMAACGASPECNDWSPDAGCCYRCFYTDINGDTYVNAKDSVILGTAFGTKPGDAKWNPAADINKDNHVNAMDAVAFGQKFGASC